MTLKEKLTALRKLFSDKRQWTQQTYFRRAGQNGPYTTNFKPVERTCYCLAGGLNKISDRDIRSNLQDSELRALGFSTSVELFNWNDAKERTISEVRTRIDEALDQLPKKNKEFSV